MSDAQLSEAGRALAQARWGDRKLRTAVELVVSRAGQLDGPLRDQLRTAIDDRRAADDER
jgi:hypothetical protein